MLKKSIFKQLNLSSSTEPVIEWDMTPDLAFCTFSAKGMRDELINTQERICYFFIDNWGKEPVLYLMERGTRHVNILAEIKAPQEMLIDCMVKQGGTATSRDNFSIDAPLKEWLLAKVVEAENSPYLIPTTSEKTVEEEMEVSLPTPGEIGCSDRVTLPAVNDSFTDDQLGSVIQKWNFFDAELNPEGTFTNALADTGMMTVLDERTGLIWQREGLDLSSIRSMKGKIEQLNKEGFAGSHNWRMPSLEEALSLMEPAANTKGVFLHPCFSREQPFIFVAARRKPTGYWFVDYAQGKVYWSSGTVPGGFCRLCRSAD